MNSEHPVTGRIATDPDGVQRGKIRCACGGTTVFEVGPNGHIGGLSRAGKGVSQNPASSEAEKRDTAEDAFAWRGSH